MENLKIPILNQRFELRTFIIIFRKLLWLIVLVFIISIIAGLLFFRYTKPVFNSSSVLQIKFENKSNQILGISTGLIEQELAPAIELLRSNEFLKTCIIDLPLDISYYNQGTFLSSELYQNSPYEINYRINILSILDQKIFLSETSEHKFEINYDIGNRTHKYAINADEWHSLYGLDIFISYNNQIKEGSINGNSKHEFYFVINDPKTVLNKISSNLIVQTLNETAGTIKISYSDHNPRKAAEITNTIAEKFIKFDENRKKESAVNILNYIDNQLEVVLNQLNESEEALHDFRLRNNIKPSESRFIQDRASILTTKLGEIESKIFIADLEIITLDKIAERINSQDETINIYEMLALLTGQQSEKFLSTMLNSVLSLEQQKEELLFDVTANNHKIIRINAQIESKKNLIDDFIKSMKIRLNNQVSEYKSRYEELESKITTDILYDEIEYAKLLRLHSIHEEFYSQLLKTKAETMISQAGYISDNLILEKANIAFTPEYPNLTKTILSALGLALLFSLLVLTIRYLFYNRIHSVKDISEFSSISVIGGIPMAKKDMKVSQVVVIDRPKSMMAEAFRNIRTNLEFYRTSYPSCRVITISSTIAGEGKTFVALNTGAIYAMADKKVIILDMDLRKPRLHKSFEVDNETGISNYLIGKCSLNDCIKQTPFDNYDFITSGPLPPNPAEIVLTDKYKELIHELKKEYEVIIIDTPPIGIVTDALASFHLADNPLYIMRAGTSPKSFIENINSFKESNNLENMGIILNSIERSNVRFGYGYKTGYGYQYGHSGYGYGYGYLTKIHNSYYGEEVEDKKNFFQKLFQLKTFKQKISDYYDEGNK